MNSRFQAALRREVQSVPPIWMMRQAGRYHRHYQSLRKKHGFMELCKNPKLAAQVALGPVEDFDFDVSILFSDLLFPLEALGMGLDYDLGPPRLDFSLSLEHLSRLRTVDAAIPYLEFQREAVSETRRVLPTHKSLIGFVGGPWTLLGYAVDGSHSGGLKKSKQLAPKLIPPFFELLVPLLKKNIDLQLQGGAEVVMILDTAAGELSLDEWRSWVLPSLKDLAAQHPGKTAYYMRGATAEHWRALREAWSQPGFSIGGIGFDAQTSLTEALALSPGFVQGNFHQQHMTLDGDHFRRELDRWLEPLLRMSPSERRGWVCGVGHGLTPQAREDNVRAFVRIIRELFQGAVE